MTIDIDALREDMKNECNCVFFGGGFGGALMESFDIEDARRKNSFRWLRDKESI